MCEWRFDMRVCTFALALSLVFPLCAAVAEQKEVTEFARQITAESCGDQGEWLKEYNLPPAKCGEITRAIVGPCVKRELGTRTIPLKSEAELQQVSEGIFACMKDTFLAQYGGGANAAAAQQ